MVGDLSILLGFILLAFLISDRVYKYVFKKRIVDEDNGERCHFFAENMSEAIILHENGVIKDINRQGVELLQCTREELLEQSLFSFFPFVEQRFLKVRLEGSSHSVCEGELLRPDGSSIPVELQSKDSSFQKIPVQIILMRDISDVKHRRMTNLAIQQRMEQAERLEAVGTLAGGIAHDFNNILYSAMGFGEIALKNLHQPEKVEHCLQQMRKSHERAISLVEQMLIFSRKGVLKKEKVFLPKLVENVLNLSQKNVPSNVEICKDISPHCPRIFADPSQLQQIILNLMTNSFQAMEKGGKVEVSVGEMSVDMMKHRGLKPEGIAPYCVLKMKDNGHGMEQGVQDRIYEPFFTTKPVGEGTGLGLATVHGIVKEANGFILCKSKLNEGTSFEIFFPPYLIEEKIVTAADWNNTLHYRSISILLVDDDARICDYLKEVFKEIHFPIVTFIDSQRALDYLKKHAGDVDLLICDLYMPKMTGDLLAAAAREIKKDLPVILITSYETQKQSMLQLECIDSIIFKPIQFEVLYDEMIRLVGRGTNDE